MMARKESPTVTRDRSFDLIVYISLSLFEILSLNIVFEVLTWTKVYCIKSLIASRLGSVCIAKM
jgi:hypothetical protein